jgi:hypothetical protein
MYFATIEVERNSFGKKESTTCSRQDVSRSNKDLQKKKHDNMMKIHRDSRDANVSEK